MKRALVLIVAAACFFAHACQNYTSNITPEAEKSGQKYTPPQFEGPPLVLSVLPVERVGAMYERFLPLRYYLENVLKRPVVIKVARDYETAMLEIGTGLVQLAFLDPATYCEVRKRYRNKVTPLVKVIGNEGATSHSALVTKNGSGIERVVDVKGKRLALGSQQSSFSYLIPLAMLNDVGIRTKNVGSVDYLQQEDRVALSVLIGNHDVGGMSESVARKYAADGLKIIKISEAIPRFALCASEILPEEIRGEVRKSLISMKDSQTLTSIDKDITGFAVAEDRDFDMVRVMIKNITGKDYIEYGPKTMKVALLPLYSAITLYDRYEPLMRYLTRATGYEFKLVIPNDFDDFMKLVKSRKVEFSYQNPYIFALIDREVDLKPLVTTISSAGAEGSRGDQFRGIIITRSDSGISDVNGLRGKKVMVTSPKSAGGYLSQKIFLLQRGINPEREMQIIDAKRHDNVILGVYRGEADAGFIRESALDELKELIDVKKIRILARTRPLPNWPFALCGNVSASLVKEVKRLLTELGDKEVLKAARIKGFRPADDTEFESLKGY